MLQGPCARLVSWARPSVIHPQWGLGWREVDARGMGRIVQTEAHLGALILFYFIFFSFSPFSNPIWIQVLNSNFVATFTLCLYSYK
jgi:hypothetical protein